jgi:hypothetical protein
MARPHSNASIRAGTQDTLFAWTIGILILIGAALLCWIGGFYLFSHPEKPSSYKFLRKIGKLPDVERFVATEAPAGEFLNAAKLANRYLQLSPEKILSTNEELLRNYVRNFERSNGLVPYVAGKFIIVSAQKLDSESLFPNGAVALAQSVDNPDLFIEHVFPTLPAAPSSVGEADKAIQFLKPGLPLVLRSGDDLSAIIHVERFPDGRLLFTVVPLIYGSYIVSKTGAGFECAPPAQLNVGSAAPLFKKSQELIAARADAAPRSSAIASIQSPQTAQSPATLSPSPAPSAVPQLAAIEPAPEPSVTPQPVEPATVTPPVQPPIEPAIAPTPAPSVTIAQAEPPTIPPGAPETPAGTPPLQPFLGAAVPGANPTPKAAWPLFAAGGAPEGRALSVEEAAKMVDSGVPRGAMYLSGDFVVTGNGPSKAVLRPRDPVSAPAAPGGGLQPFFGNGGGPAGGNDPAGRPRGGVRVIVEYPPGVQPPADGAPVSHNNARPLAIVEVTRASNGTVNIHAREITAP